MEDNLEKILEEHENIISLNSNTETREISSDDHPFTLTLRIKDIEDERELNRFVKFCEGLVRRSPEYKIWTSYIREVLGYLSCEITKESHIQTTVEIHHHPISLYSIVKGIIGQYIASGTEFCSFDICIKVIELHYELRIGFIPLITSLHEKFHKGFLAIPINLIHGDYQYFVSNYGSFLEDSELEIIQSRLTINFENCGFHNDGYLWSRDNYVATGG